MAQNPFHPDALDPIGKPLTEIIKGGPGSGAQPGHPFEGNQYNTAVGGGTHLAPWQKARNAATTASEIRERERMGGGSRAYAHDVIANTHTAIGKELLKAAEDAKADPASATSKMVKDSIRGAELAAQAHFAAATAHSQAAGHSGYERSDGWEKAKLDQAEAASHAAAALTDDVITTGERANDRVQY
jgi:hypothetical protein